MLLIGFVAASERADAQPDPARAAITRFSSLEESLGLPIVATEVVGPAWAMELGRNLPVRAGMPLSRDRMQNAVLHFSRNAAEDLSHVRVFAEPATARNRKGV